MNNKFLDQNFQIYNKNNIIIKFRNYEVDDFGYIKMVFWVQNQTSLDIQLRAYEIVIDGEKYDSIDRDEIGKILPRGSGYLSLYMPYGLPRRRT